MRRARRIAISTAVTTGVLGVGGVAAAAIPGTLLASGPTAGTTSGSSAQEKQALQDALDQLQAQTKTLGGDLTSAQAQLEAARRAAAAAAAARAVQHTGVGWSQPSARPSSKRKVVYIQVPATSRPTPSPHTTTGASGSAGGDDGGQGDGGGDD